MAWDSILAKDFCKSVRDGTHDTPKQMEMGYKLVTSKCIHDGFIFPEEAYFISEKDYRAINERSLVEQWDVLMSMIGNGLGRSAVVKQKPDYAIKNLALFKVGDEYKAKWLHYYLSSPVGQGLIYNSLQGSGQPFISLNLLRNFAIPNPPYEAIKKIVSVLELYDNLIENNQKQIKLLEEAAQRLYKQWFIDLRFPGHETTPIIDGLPEGWRKGIVGEIAEFKRGKVITKAQVAEGNIPVVAGGLEPAYYHNTANTTAPVITVSGSGANAGFAQLYNENVFASDCSFADINTTPYVYFVYCLLKDKKTELDSLQKGAAQPHVYAKDINALATLIPPEEMLKLYTKYASPYFEKVKALKEQIKNLTQSRDRLLPKLMNGEIEA
ncbi:MAG: restriction endonuclease subunit S [Fibrobacter intestinalis]|uniref:restriction endonuclease subunit S n=1 Tax=Fibrobacter intestinalis TaxID=28122 RepID=UPI003F04A19C